MMRMAVNDPWGFDASNGEKQLGKYNYHPMNIPFKTKEYFVSIIANPSLNTNAVFFTNGKNVINYIFLTSK